MPTTPNGVFVEVTTSSGEVYWATAPAFQPSLPYFRLYDANLAQATVFELIMLSPASTHVGAYLSRQGLATRADPNVGTYIRVNFDEFFAYFGAQFDPSGVEFDPVSGSSLEETITDFGYDINTPNSHDALINVNNLLFVQLAPGASLPSGAVVVNPSGGLRNAISVAPIAPWSQQM